MWKNIKCCINSTSLSRYSDVKHDVIKLVLSSTKVEPINYLRIRNQTTDAKDRSPSFMSNSVGKRPPPTYLRDIQPSKPKPSQKITPGEWMLLAVPIATFALGTWQVQRRKWKIGIIENLEKKTAEPPIDFPDDLAELATLEYRKVKVRGKFDHSKEVFLGPRTLITKGQISTQGGVMTAPGSTKKTGGHCLITPFILSDSGKRILINRGWVPTANIQPQKRLEGQIEGEVEIVGVVRLQEKRGTFIPENKPHLNLFHYRDVNKMAKKCDALPVLLDADEDSTIPGGPIGGQTNVSIRNEHMSYIITWYSLSAITVLLWCKKCVFR